MICPFLIWNTLCRWCRWFVFINWGWTYGRWLGGRLRSPLLMGIGNRSNDPRGSLGCVWCLGVGWWGRLGTMCRPGRSLGIGRLISGSTCSCGWAFWWKLWGGRRCRFGKGSFISVLTFCEKQRFFPSPMHTGRPLRDRGVYCGLLCF